MAKGILLLLFLVAFSVRWLVTTISLPGRRRAVSSGSLDQREMERVLDES